MELREVVANQLDAARRRSLDLLDPLPEPVQVHQHSPLMSPLVWDLAHVGNYEELWLLRALGGKGIRPEYDETYDAFRHTRSQRPALALLSPAQARAYIRQVRDQVLCVLDKAHLDSEADPLLRQAFVYGMVAQHEQQHDETMLATLQLAGRVEGLPELCQPWPQGAAVAREEVLVEGGSFVMGTDTEPWAFDNERPSHQVDVSPFFIDTVPVTSGSYMQFMESGGYDEPRWWAPEGWQWRQESSSEHPLFWSKDGRDTWVVQAFGRVEPVAVDRPVQHVCWYEADAYARWAGKRLPTEAEWEKAASWGPEGAKVRYPWGDAPCNANGTIHANLGQGHSGPAPVGAYPRGVSPWGVHQMLGDIWEWTASDFLPYQGFKSFPYPEYSEVFYGSAYKVLRGGSWATHESVARCTFRNWDYPIRRQIFAGFRCARDA